MVSITETIGKHKSREQDASRPLYFIIVWLWYKWT